MTSGIYIRTEKDKKRIIKNLVFNNRKGKKNSDESKIKTSKSMKGKIFSEEHKKNMSKSKTIELRKKISEKLKGEKATNWQGGITLINKKIRNSLEYKLWRESVFKRDNFICQKTGQKGGKLVVHHINNFSNFPELRTSISNGITLSKEAHIEFHKIYGKRNNSRKQLEKFLNKKI